MLVVKMLPKGLIPCGQRQTYLQMTLSKLLIKPLLSKIKNRDTLWFTSRKELSNITDYISQNYITTMKKQTKKEKSTHKLHSLHPFI